jgi:C-terminal processing protease CtpA/Prc
MPLALLVNEASASASEVFAGAIKDHRLGTIVGERTYGKASVQSVVHLKDLLPGEAGGGLKITTAHYYTPNNVDLNREEGKKEYGLEPDVEVPMTAAEEREVFGRREDGAAPKPAADKQLDRAVGDLRRQLETPAGGAGVGATKDAKPAEAPPASR